MHSNPPLLLIAALFTAAYCAGCLNTGYYLVRLLRGQDLRTLNSGTAGARNTARLLGKAGFIATFAGDAGKAAIILLLGRYGVAQGMDPRLVPWLIPIVVAGHIWPAQLRFRGGKGLSSSAGAFLVADWRAVAGFLLVNAIFRLVLRSERAGLFASLSAIPPLAVFFLGRDWAAPSLLLSAMLVFAHRANLGLARRSDLLPSRAGNP